ncbi:leucine-rich repeat-containing protein 40-like [Bombyx mandarina]|uniref:Leucine-rich repeat-containing protein 40-like n=1 Tax=Bombyx mandarina TaxID=7092 RepID=A0A6J2JVC7_BOMMA|nr:leucine-rich repeat-containing protein 40-like [Bombyx mandarina]
MTLKHLCLLLLITLVTCEAGIKSDETPIPVETDNQFPPETNSELDGSILDGSGGGPIEEPIEVTTLSSAPLLEDVQLTANAEGTATQSGDSTCPKPCVCHTEGDSSNFVVDCSGYGLTEFPTPLDVRTTILNLQNNKLTGIPKDVASLKNLKVLNANKNSIMGLDLGSVSELPGLTVLKLGNNRLIEYPQDLKNGFSLTKLEELDLGGNDIRTALTTDLFSNFKGLRKLTLPSAASSLNEELCNSFKGTLESVCTESCKEHLFECPDARRPLEGEGWLDAISPGTIALTSIYADESHSAIKPEVAKTAQADTKQTETQKNTEPLQNSQVSLRTAINSAPIATGQTTSTVESNKEKDTDVKVAVGATTAETKSGGVDKSIIGMMVAGMVVIVAGITIKKNWSSIRNRFSSSPRAANERSATTANGTTPEEVPLQEKSPV